MVELELDMSINLRRTHPKVRACRGKMVLTRGPLVYCLESVDNPTANIFETRLDPASLRPVFDEHALGGLIKIEGQTVNGHPLTFIPYMLWGNRGESQMSVFMNA